MATTQAARAAANSSSSGSMYSYSNLWVMCAWFLQLLVSYWGTLWVRLWRRDALRRRPAVGGTPWWRAHGDAATALVTGGSSGVGRAVAERLAAQGLRVIITSPSPARARDAAAAIVAVVPGARVVALPLDLADADSTDDAVRQLMAMVGSGGWRLCLLVNNAAQFPAAVAATAEGIELNMATHLGHFRLTYALLDVLLPPGSRGGAARVVTVGSFTHRSARWHRFSRWLWAQTQLRGAAACGCTPAECYMHAKLCALLHAAELRRRLRRDGLSVWVADPGLVDSQLDRHWPAPLRHAYRFVSARLGLLQPPAAAAEAVVFAACAPPEAAGADLPYLMGPAATPLRPSRLARRPGFARVVWEQCEVICGAAYGDAVLPPQPQPHYRGAAAATDAGGAQARSAGGAAAGAHGAAGASPQAAAVPRRQADRAPRAAAASPSPPPRRRAQR